MAAALRRRRAAGVVLSCAALTCALTVAAPSVAAAATPLAIRVVGTHFVDGAGHVVRLLGVNHTSAEYGCVDGFGYDDGHFDDADARAIRSWGATAVRVPLNEDCWLGINGQPNSTEGADPALTRAGYQREIENYVADLNRHGLYAILDLHWTAPGSQVALEQQPMPDLDHSPAFWTSLASTFESNPAVVLDLFNEPYDPTDPRSGDDQNPSDKITWNCWETGTQDGPAGGAPCFTSAYDEDGNPTTTYRIAGMQTLLDAVRATGARQPVMTGGLDYANDLGDTDHGQAWMTHAPDDPLNQEAASFHNYMGKACDTTACWKGVVAPVAAHVPVVTGEFDEDDYLERTCGTKRASSFDSDYMAWADTAGVSYLAWGWIVETQAERDSDGCSAYYLIDDYTHYTPAAPNGTLLRAHLRYLASTPSRLWNFAAATGYRDEDVDLTVRTSQTSRVGIVGTTVHAYATGRAKPRPVSFGTVRFSTVAGRSRTVAVALSRQARSLLIARRTLAVRYTITLVNADQRRVVLVRTTTLHATPTM